MEKHIFLITTSQENYIQTKFGNDEKKTPPKSTVQMGISPKIGSGFRVIANHCSSKRQFE